MVLKKVVCSLKWICLVGLVLGLGAFFVFKGSLPPLDGEILSRGIKEHIFIDRDAQGIVSLRGKDREDIAFAIGFAHAQDRFFQMDLMRRLPAGELSALFGKKTLAVDQQHRFHQFRKRSSAIVSNLSLKERGQLKAYVQGVNAGLASLTTRPFEYILLRETPKPWTEEDTVLVGIGFFFQMQDNKGQNDWTRGIMEATLPKDVATFFLQNGSNWQAALDDSLQPILPIPSKEQFSYLTSHEEVENPNHFVNDIKMGGSNQWAVSPKWTQNFRPLLSNDMHLRLALPNVWYRATFRYHNQNGHERYIAGLTLPGTPAMIIGSNRKIAWGFTNAFVDTTDLAIISLDQSKQDHYLTPEGSLPFENDVEMIEVKGQEPHPFTIKKTIWGPVCEQTYLGQPVALLWGAHSNEAFNLRLTDLEEITKAEEALKLGPQFTIPVLNLMVVDTKGNIGWTLTGAIPNRIGFDGTVPVSFADGSNRWDGFLKEAPIIMNPSHGRLWTANHRILGEPWDKILGKTGQLNGIRGVIIRDSLMDLSSASPQDMLDIQMNIDGAFFNRWQEILLALPSHDETVKPIQAIVSKWDGQASDTTAFYWIRLFREKVTDHVLQYLLKPCCHAWEKFDPNTRDFEEPVYAIVSQKPDYLVPPPFKTFDDMLVATLNDLVKEHPDSMDAYTWGQKNKIRMRHPLSGELSFFKAWLDLPETASSGDYYTPKVIGERVGASQRMIVSPGHEEEGMMHMPGGQSGHPLSPFYRAGHDDWLEGKYTPFLPGPVQHTLILTPAP